MSERARQAGKYELLEFKLEKLKVGVSGNTSAATQVEEIDLLGKVTNFTISESMGKTYISGQASIYDAHNLIENFPISGEEILTIRYRDFFEEERTDRMFVYSVRDHKLVKEGDDQIVTYNLHFCSLDKFYADTTSVNKSYRGTIGEMAELVFDEFYTRNGAEKKIEVEATDGTSRLIVPNYRPDEALNFLARRAHSIESYSSFYRFFETRDGFFFTTPEYHVRKAENKELKRFAYNMEADTSPEGQVKLMNGIVSVNFGTRVDTMSELKNGGYIRKTMELDILNRAPVLREYNHLEQRDKFDMPGNTKLAHNEEFIKEYLLDAPTSYVIKDYPSEGAQGGVAGSVRDNPGYTETYGRKTAYAFHHFNNSISVVVYGRASGVAPGDIIELDMYKFQYSVDKREANVERSGKYIVESVINQFSNDVYTQVLVVSKGALGA